jgi:hypothetical protein
VGERGRGVGDKRRDRSGLWLVRVSLCKGDICIEVRLEDSIAEVEHHVTIVKTRGVNQVFEVDLVLTTRTLASPGRGICYPPTCMPLEKPSLAKIRVRVFRVKTFDPEMCSLSFLDGCVSQSKKEIRTFVVGWFCTIPFDGKGVLKRLQETPC